MAQLIPISSLRANGSRECVPDDRLREAIHETTRKLDCFVAYAPLRKRFAFVAGNDGGGVLTKLAIHLRGRKLHRLAATASAGLVRIVEGELRRYLVGLVV